MVKDIPRYFRTQKDACACPGMFAYSISSLVSAAVDASR